MSAPCVTDVSLAKKVSLLCCCSCVPLSLSPNLTTSSDFHSIPMSSSSFDLNRLDPTQYENKQDARIVGNIVTLTSDFLDFLRSPEGSDRSGGDVTERNTALKNFFAIVDDASIVPLIQNDIWDKDDDQRFVVSLRIDDSLTSFADMEYLLASLYPFSTRSAPGLALIEFFHQAYPRTILINSWRRRYAIA